MNIISLLGFNTFKEQIKLLQKQNTLNYQIIKIQEKEIKLYEDRLAGTDKMNALNDALIADYRSLNVANEELISLYKTKLEICENMNKNYEALEQARSEQLMKTFDKLNKNGKKRLMIPVLASKVKSFKAIGIMILLTMRFFH